MNLQNVYDINDIDYGKDKHYLIAKNLKKTIGRYVGSNRTIALPSIQSLSQTYNCTSFDVLHALSNIRDAGYDYKFESSVSPLIIWKKDKEQAQ